MIQEFTIPQPGTPKKFSVQGRSVLVFQAPTYSTWSDIPYFDFVPGESTNLITPKSKIPNTEWFNSLMIHGTSASAGDQIVLDIKPFCVNPYYNILFAQTDLVTVGDTTEVTIDGSLFSFLNIHKIKNNQLARSADLYVANSDLLVAYGSVDPDNATNFGKRIKAGEHYKIQGQDRVDTFTAINADSTIKSILTFDMDF